MLGKKTILIAGYYGFGNVGDEAILSAMLAGLREQQEDLEFIVVSGNPTETMSNYDVQSIHWKDVEALLNAAKESDLIILGGGGLFQDYWGVPKGTSLTPSHWGISYYSAIGMLAVLYQKPFMLYSVGVGPLLSEEGRQLTRWTFEVANVVTVRDAESKELLIELGIQEENIAVLPDPVLALELDSTSAAEILRSHDIDFQTRPLLGVCIRNWGEGAKAAQWKRELAAAMDQFIVAHDMQALFIPFQVEEHTLENDHSVALDVVSMMQNQDRVYLLSESYSPALAGGLISHCHLVLGMRLHSLIFAANAGLPAIALVYDPKVSSLMRSLGLSEYEVDLLSLTREQLSRVLESVWAEQKTVEQTLGIHLETLRTLAKKTPAIAMKLLDKGSSAPFPPEVLQSITIQQTRVLAAKEQELQALLTELEAKEHEAFKLKSRLDEILHSKAWKLAQMFRNSRIFLLPIGSRRVRFIGMFYRYSKELYRAILGEIASIRQSVRQQGLRTAFLEGLKTVWIRMRSLRAGNQITQKDLLLIKSSGLFDETWYLNNNPDVALSEIDPLLHYLNNGGFEGRDPSPQFSSLWYLNRYEDVKKVGMNPLLHYLKYGRAEDRIVSSVNEALTSQVLEPYRIESHSDTYKKVRNVVDLLNQRSLGGIFVVTSAFVFDEFFNQRVINLSKFLSQQGWGVVYVAWRWSDREDMRSIGEEVYKNIFQIPVDMFLKNMDAFTQVQYVQKHFLIEFPYPGFFLSGLRLRSSGFKLVYDIVDEWEEFHKVGQAVWFNKSIENALVINANIVTAVSLPLVEKFSLLRQDIYLSPNGYTAAFLGEEHRNIAWKERIQKDEMHLGYFGHLTEAWFDWDFLLKVLSLARKKNFKLCVHLIGYGEPNLQQKLGRYVDQVKFYGKVHPSELYKYIKEWDAAMIWFRSGKLSEAVDPIKIYEYLYFGLPTIVKGINHLRDFPLTYVVENESQALDTLMALGGDELRHYRRNPELTLAVEQMLVKSTWEQRFIDLLKVLESEKRILL